MWGCEVRSEAEVVFLSVGLMLSLLIMFSLVVWMCIASFRLEEILDHLGRSPAVVSKKYIVEGNLISRFFLLNHVGALLVFHRQSLRSGRLDAKDNEDFPLDLRRLISVCYLSILVLGVGLFVAGFVGRYFGWLI